MSVHIYMYDKENFWNSVYNMLLHLAVLKSLWNSSLLIIVFFSVRHYSSLIRLFFSRRLLLPSDSLGTKSSRSKIQMIIFFHYNSQEGIHTILSQSVTIDVSHIRVEYTHCPKIICNSSWKPSLSRSEQMQRHMSGFVVQIYMCKQKPDICRSIRSSYPWQAQFLRGDSDYAWYNARFFFLHVIYNTEHKYTVNTSMCAYCVMCTVMCIHYIQHSPFEDFVL